MTSGTPATPDIEAQAAPALLMLVRDGAVFISVRVDFPHYLRNRHTSDHDYGEPIITRFTGSDF
ncbi:hypothetical protein [Arthrobacter agilis]|uniref:hypothetical protein n=1 Tax=Arthrobacter agilis TaxID=37921 RepID=UPI00277D69D6|nr:hypothetical protein [Arthrobacter agilis]MDQ0734658.1 hypothetical protein [Arthrobacter agilis]